MDHDKCEGRKGDPNERQNGTFVSGISLGSLLGPSRREEMILFEIMILKQHHDMLKHNHRQQM